MDNIKDKKVYLKDFATGKITVLKNITSTAKFCGVSHSAIRMGIQRHSKVAMLYYVSHSPII